MNLKTRARSVGARYLSSAVFQDKQQSKARKRRAKLRQPPLVHYFHQVSDPYSHLTVQKLDQLISHYSLPFQPHLVSKPDATYQGSAAHFEQWALNDAKRIGRDYGTIFTPSIKVPKPDAVARANQVLASHLNQDNFASAAFEIGEALWSHQPIEATTTLLAGAQAVEEGNALRKALGHYQGAMFYFDGEWYWGIDRIRRLEERLRLEGYVKENATLCVPEPTAADTQGLNAGHISLEYFPSLRSPYTAVGHQRVVDLIARSGVSLEVRPVMPMLMRGIPAPREKQRYIITDAAREGRACGAPLGRIVDPFGEPVKRAFALFPGADKLGKGMDFVTAYLSAAWQEGIDITTRHGLQQVANKAGIDWNTLQLAAQDTDWEAILEDNLRTMLESNLWGVPSFRISGGRNDRAYACWGQDRIWRLENEIARRI